MDLSAALCALYLRGGPVASRGAPRRWKAACSALRSVVPSRADSAEALRVHGLYDEAMLLQSAGLLEWASDLVVRGRAIAACSPCYPPRWLAVLAEAAPAALYAVGSICARDCISVVGSRFVSPAIHDVARAVGAEAARLGLTVVSGGAAGCDRSAVDGCLAAGGNALEVLPCGVPDSSRHPRLGALSANPCGTPFSAAAAMERNALIFAASPWTVVIHARFKEGGAWHGAIRAQRSRLSRLIVWEDPESLAHRSLIALGGIPLRRPEDLGEAMAAGGAQMRLFTAAG